MLSESGLHIVEMLLSAVLILVLLEYALWVLLAQLCQQDSRVLILVLLEYALWGVETSFHTETRKGLNPCSVGICSLSHVLNKLKFNEKGVLILVLLEYALWGKCWCKVRTMVRSLNPCSVGICSLSSQSTSRYCWCSVLILVLLEYALWVPVPVSEKDTDWES